MVKNIQHGTVSKTPHSMVSKTQDSVVHKTLYSMVSKTLDSVISKTLHSMVSKTLHCAVSNTLYSMASETNTTGPKSYLCSLSFHLSDLSSPQIEQFSALALSFPVLEWDKRMTYIHKYMYSTDANNTVQRYVVKYSRYVHGPYMYVQ